LLKKYGKIQQIPCEERVAILARALQGLEEAPEPSFIKSYHTLLQGQWPLMVYAAPNITITKDHPLIITGGQTLASYGVVTVEEGGYIEIGTHCNFHADKITGQTSETLFRVIGRDGKDGRNGAHGSPGSVGARGRDGTCKCTMYRGDDPTPGGVGSDGTPGHNGSAGEQGDGGYTITITIEKLNFSIYVSARSGNGGNGGHGGHGGRGGDGGEGGGARQCGDDWTHYTYGGDGANGAKGGNGANGGNGGPPITVQVCYTPARPEIKVWPVPCAPSRGGEGGMGGAPGQAGHGGESGFAGVHPGQPGAPGSPVGQNGERGTDGQPSTINIYPLQP